jgi:hypothetical protein
VEKSLVGEVVDDVPDALGVTVRLPVERSADRGQSLLAVEQVVDAVPDREKVDVQVGDGPLARQLLVAVPEQDAADGIVAGDGVQQVEDLLAGPDEVSLKFGQENAPRADVVGDIDEPRRGGLGIARHRSAGE